eukprot:COSAG01_NODE_2301_length_7953_cov_4.000127_7_plen_79_part_00
MCRPTYYVLAQVCKHPGGSSFGVAKVNFLSERTLSCIVYTLWIEDCLPQVRQAASPERRLVTASHHNEIRLFLESKPS